ncbi:flagellar biosynthesis protein FlhB [Jeotgalibacillus proteolyticus]|uniref:Flagellar biosynthetic protein FlhB n=1 Tax=Jeotgalibacillus proteolyticus TaxID=2082395 RepID=A0A2S5GGJ2_9BACL|nr:flagellar biosynthesis protein FlhB [Jeotgalibacillus proteolyticus]PPA72044.1 flagellar biosynthesis protein FlhB [Jeotgalibacillus proteolyticus]
MRYIPLNLQFFAGEKTEKATPKKRQDSRKKGQLAKSQDVNTAIILFAVFLFLFFAGGMFEDRIKKIVAAPLKDYIHRPVTIDTFMIVFTEILGQAAWIVLPIMGVAAAGGIIGNYVQVGFLVSSDPLKPQLSKIDPIKGFKRIFSARALVELIKSILKISLIGLTTFAVLWFSIEHVLALSLKTAETAMLTIGKLTVQMGLYASALLLLLSVLDYFYQKYDFEKNIRMSKQDLKDEYKNTEGDPLIKSKIKQRQREMAMKRMMSEIPNADVVITNPTHYAIVLTYKDGESDAPIVVAKGVDFIAQKIKLIAKENDVIAVENRPLARALFSQAEIGDPIPEDFFKAVAEILAYVYRIKNKV